MTSIGSPGQTSRAELAIRHGDVHPGWEMRDLLAAEFRHVLCESLTGFSPDKAPGVGMVPFVHQADWWAASEGKLLSDKGHPAEDVLKAWEKAGNKRHLDLPSKIIFERQEYWRLMEATPDGLDVNFTYRRLLKRPGGPARVLWQIGAFKSGKSLPAAVWMASFGIVPMIEWDMVGMTYDTSSPEFNYIERFLLGSEGLGLRAHRHVNNPKGGDIQIKLENGATFSVRSYDRAEGLEGKERDGYTFTEAYQLPGLQAFDDISQNLDKRNGYGHFPTTPKRPWVGIAAKLAMSGDPAFSNWHVVFDIPRKANPTSYNIDREAQARKTMTAETFAFSWEGKLGQYVGQVYNFRAGQQICSPDTHPDMWKDPNGPATVENLCIPQHWKRLNGADTGTYRAAVIGCVNPYGEIFFLFELCNYRYVGTSIEEIRKITISVWADDMKKKAAIVGSRFEFLADHNTQFKSEMLNQHQIILTRGVKDPELRSDLLKGLFQQGKIWLMPWLRILPRELEAAEYPKKESTATGRRVRSKKDDHMMDCAEHIGAKHVGVSKPKKETDPALMGAIALMKYRNARVSVSGHLGNPWLGSAGTVHRG